MNMQGVQHQRAQTAYQFELQATRLQFRIVAKLRNFRYKLYDERHARELTAIIVVKSFDFYRLRLNQGKHRVDMVICERHTCMLPVRCVSLEESHEYAVHSPPRQQRMDRKRRNADEIELFVSQLLLGTKKAYVELATMPLRQQQRYLKRRDAYLRPKRGRPWAS